MPLLKSSLLLATIISILFLEVSPTAASGTSFQVMESRSPEKSHPLSETTRKSLCCCRRSSHCCFCWRCCTWNRMARKRRRDGIGCKVSSISHLESPLNLEERLTAEETTSWQRSFDCMLARPSGRHIFMEFLKTEHSDENMSFWLACEDLKKEQNPELISEKAKKIYLDYISILSPKEVSIDAAVRETINNSLLSPSAHMFDEAQAQVYALMHRDSYPRFLKSALYRSLEQKLTVPAGDT